VRVLIDTNVVVSATFWPGNPKTLMNAVRRGELTYVTSEGLLEELRKVLTDQEKPFRLSAEEAGKVVDTWRALATLVSPTRFVAVCRDDDDNRVLECALDGHAEYVVTGDDDLLELEVFEGIKIITVSDFLQRHRGPE
jgi:putative PIN family toxin of toxin-antitoxin system